MNLTRVVISLGLLSLCVFFRQTLEADPVTHVLVQLPLLAISGGLFVSGLFVSTLGAGDLHPTEPLANALSLVAVVGILFWMLPRYIDAALVDPVVEIAKFVSIPVVVGGSFAFGWAKSHPFLRGFLKANAISMLGVLAFLYIHAPVRICNSYLVTDQERLGFAFLMTAIGLAVAWAIPLFAPPPRRTPFLNSESSQ
ncbi:MAG: hypothetical protein QGG19_16290 [Alphaproteobacteria bacterium]|jgi:hypothetical protein|nr:hypothetical protein [Rhodospirillaceae bacterium]MDP6022837.1 hypothetical protein [Alphaproteobacteria bacterium]MDP7459044.1 hypothetical protein [Alphaproteobacteria bacterium]|tara:strand:+ start:3264 stop:3854 length:591 start_codon:yes stop_codon:yes gene_type:complete